MALRLLFDTNAASVIIRGKTSLLATAGPDAEVVLPLAVVGELLYGAFHSGDPAKQLERVQEFVSQFAVGSPDVATAEVYGQIKADLRRQGGMIPDNDLWIAATAIHLGIPLVTQDAHFGRVAGITVIGW